MNTLQALSRARECGVSPAMLHVLLVAIDDSPITPTRIAEATGITTAAVTGACDRLARDGWVHRANNPHDRRSWHVTPTERAFEAFAGMLDQRDLSARLANALDAILKSKQGYTTFPPEVEKECVLALAEWKSMNEP